MRTALTEQFGITHPIVSAGMARVAQAPLVAAVSEAGAMGCLGGVSYFADALRDEVRAVRRATSRPFAVNLLVPPSLVRLMRRPFVAATSAELPARRRPYSALRLLSGRPSRLPSAVEAGRASEPANPTWAGSLPA